MMCWFTKGEQGISICWNLHVGPGGGGAAGVMVTHTKWSNLEVSAGIVSNSSKANELGSEFGGLVHAASFLKTFNQEGPQLQHACRDLAEHSHRLPLSDIHCELRAAVLIFEPVEHHVPICKDFVFAWSRVGVPPTP